MADLLTGDPVAPASGIAEGWLEEIARAVGEQGLLRAWEAHFPRIVRAYHEGSTPDRMLGSSLLQLLIKDSQLAGHLRGLPDGLDSRPGPPGDWAAALRDTLRARAVDFPPVLEGDGRPMKFIPGATFRNWGETVENTPSATFIPRTKAGLQNLVRWASAQGKRVRASGYRHTWGDLYSADQQVLVSLLPLDVVEDLPATEPPIDPDDQLQGIQIVGTLQEDGHTKALCRIGSATTNEQFRLWCLDQAGGNWSWTVPLNVIMVEITWGGSNAPICHGAGWRHPTLSDLVTEVEFVNAKGELQTVSDPDLLRAAAGCFGLLGIVTALTIKLDPMTYAKMEPAKPRVVLTIPPPAGFAVPPGVDMSGITQDELDRAWADFVAACEDNYYSEWFWFAYRPDCWVNSWKNDGLREDAVTYPNSVQTLIEEAAEYLGQLLNASIFKLLPGRWQADLLAAGAMAALPDGKTIVTPLIDGLHFRRGIQNMRVLDMELEIPIPPRADDPTRPDWSVCQKAWWAAIAKVYGRDDAPMRIALEMRIMAGSRILMAPQYGNTFGTCSIEVLTNLDVGAADWASFMQEIADSWDSLTGPSGARLNVRPHWAKQWQGLKFRGLDVVDYLKSVAYRDRLPEFRDRLGTIARAGGYTLDDLRRLFSNPLLDRLLGDVFGAPGLADRWRPAGRTLSGTTEAPGGNEDGSIL